MVRPAHAPDDNARQDEGRVELLPHSVHLFHDRLDSLFDYLTGCPIVLEPLAEDAVRERLHQIEDYYEARQQALAQRGPGPPYKPLSPQRLYFTEADWRARLDAAALVRLTPFKEPEGHGHLIDVGTKQGRNFAAERAEPGRNVFEAATRHVSTLKADGKRVIVALWSEGARERMCHVLADHGLGEFALVESWPQVLALPKSHVALTVLGIESGFETAEAAVIGEQDILGDRLVRPRRAARRGENFIAEVTSLAAGDLVVHVDHGIGRFAGLRAIEAAGAPHDCLEIHYAGGDKLFLPVENVELLSRYGAEEAQVELDRLGGGAWQARKARMKRRIRDIADTLIKIAAERQLREAPPLTVEPGSYDEFCAGFPYEETEDQQAAIDVVLDELASGRPMDRLICGDVGFGKTEVALRAAFVAAMNGRQVAMVVPTTLLARQHAHTFLERFRGFPVNIAQASRLVSSSELAQVKKRIGDGSADIVIGTHALLGKTIKFRDLGLLIIDEEQHFGVAHKEKLKQLRTEVHVLTLTATPIPRTLQLALSGVRDLSIIASPPVDRLAVRTFVAPFDPVIVREALLRERYRGGQSFYVCPRIEDLRGAKEFLDKHVPEVRIAVAHGQIPATVLEDIMAAFYDPAKAVQAAFEMHRSLHEDNVVRGKPALSLKIGIHHTQQVTAGESPSVHDRRCEPQPARASQHADGQLRRQGFRQLGGAVGARVVDHDELERLARRTQGLRGTSQCLLDHSGFIVSGDSDRDHRGSSESRSTACAVQVHEDTTGVEQSRMRDRVNEPYSEGRTQRRPPGPGRRSAPRCPPLHDRRDTEKGRMGPRESDLLVNGMHHCSRHTIGKDYDPND